MIIDVRLLLKGYSELEIRRGICGGRPVVKGTMIEPKTVIKYNRHQALNKLGINRTQYKECLSFVNRVEAMS